MGLELEISLESDIKNLDLFFDKLRFKAVTLAARQGLNRAASRTQSEAMRQIRKERNIKLQELKGSKKKGLPPRVRMSKATGMNLATMEASVSFSNAPLPLILFLVGKKEPIKQTRPNPKRKPRRFEIKKGVKEPKRGLFVQKAKRGTSRYQVFQRRDPKQVQEGFVKQSAPSVAEFLRQKTAMLNKIEKKSMTLLQVEFGRALENQLNKLK